ncbi:MAG: ATP-binding protein [Geminicoccaceae bacterium]|nr:ATP-binding protein [Geminicoccaceae bacterium]
MPEPAAALGNVLAVNGSALVVGVDRAAGAGQRPLTLGELVALPAGSNVAIGIVHALRHGRRAEDHAIADVQLVGEVVQAGGAPRFRRGVSVFPVLDAPVRRADPVLAAVVFAPPTATSVPVGRLSSAPDVPAHLLVDAMLGKHFAVLGSTGSGKSWTVARILNAVLEVCPAAHIVLLDPHGEYAAAFGPRAEALDLANLELPYWLMNFEETAAILAPQRDGRGYTEASILKEALLAARLAWAKGNGGAGGPVTVDTPIPYRLTDLVKLIDEAMGALNKAEGAAPYRHLLTRIESIRADRRYAFLFQSLYVRDNMDQVLGRLLRFPVEGRPVTVIDLSGVPSEIVDVVVSLLCRMLFEFGLWSERGRATPLLLVCEEAHRYVPASADLGFEPSRRAIDRIAKEGRKYGVSLGLVTQRPAELSPSALSQCGTVVALRMANERDQAFVRTTLPEGSDWLLASLPALATGEAIVLGEGVTLPMRVQLDPLPPGAQPASHTPAFSQAWREDRAGLDLVRDTVRRWREQRR